MKKKILLTNDDGIHSSGIKIIHDILQYSYDVTVIAPDVEKSGTGHSFTHNKPLFVDHISNGYSDKMYSVTGSPADCVKIGLTMIMNQIPDLIISGINIGENSGISSHYSGTIAAAREGSFLKIKSYAFSISEKGKQFCTDYAKKIPDLIHSLLEFKSLLLNINFPDCNPERSRGIKVTRQSTAFFDDHYRIKDVYECNRLLKGYFLHGEKTDIESDEEFDSRALLNGWITITPMTADATAYNEIHDLKEVEKLLKGNSYDR